MPLATLHFKLSVGNSKDSYFKLFVILKIQEQINYSFLIFILTTIAINTANTSIMRYVKEKYDI